MRVTIANKDGFDCMRFKLIAVVCENKSINRAAKYTEGTIVRRAIELENEGDGFNRAMVDSVLYMTSRCHSFFPEGRKKLSNSKK